MRFTGREIEADVEHDGFVGVVGHLEVFLECGYALVGVHGPLFGRQRRGCVEWVFLQDGS